MAQVVKKIVDTGEPVDEGFNVKYVVKDGHVLVDIDLTKRGSVSSSGKSVIVASTQGNVTIQGTDVKLGINCYVPNK